MLWTITTTIWDKRMHSLIKMLFLSTAFALTGCSDGTQLFSSAPSQSTPQAQGTSAVSGYYKVGNPYQVAGVWYYPKEDFGYKEIGVASWYGPDFHNGITANGELYDMHGLTAAHRTLPLPSIARITNLQNGRSLVLRINDRGPFVNNRVIDVSMRAAQLLGFKDQGTTQVQVEILPEESRALRDELLVGGSGAVREQIDVVITQEAATLDDAQPTEIRPAPPKSLTINANHPRLANAPPPLASTDAPLISSSASEMGTSQYNDWDDDLPKTQAQKVVYEPPVTPKVAQKPVPKAPAQKTIAKTPAKKAAPLAVVPMTDVAPGYYVQVGAFGSVENAEKMRDKVAGFGAVVTTPVSVNGKTLYRVRLGPSNAKKALEIMDKVTASGVAGARLVEEKSSARKPVAQKAAPAEPFAGQRLDDEF